MRGTAVLLVLLLAAGCSSGAHPAATPSPSTTSSPSTTPAPGSTPPSPSISAVANPKLNERCPNQTDGIRAVPFMFPSGDGTRLTGLELGTGPRGVVMVHELGGAGMKACVVLSGDLWSEDLGGITGEGAAGRLAVPLFYAVATDDGDRLATARRVVARVKLSLVTLHVLGGPDHGWDLLQDPGSGRFTPLAAQVLAFLSTRTR